ncbi:MAG: ATP-binding protein [Muribaculaceae bacterium]|nr:ATP-binding protein [Muribaculaceae bacterium]MCM1560213.1 ATP-binding protein [Butyrivibrio sp.]
MIFVSGIHGVGKTYFCNMIKEKLGIKNYSASQLIAGRRGKSFSADKFVSEIDDNQVLLLDAINELRQADEEFILDGHFCLLNKNGVITRIPMETYILLKPDTMILLLENSKIIAERRLQRDGIQQDERIIADFQDAEKVYAVEIAKQLNIPLEISGGASDLERIVEIIKTGGH